MYHSEEDYPVLIAQGGTLNGQRWVLDQAITIGRDEACEISIPNRQVSRYHARLSLTREGILLEDLGSKNGTHHNGRFISEPILLQDGDIIQIALAQQFSFLSSDATIPLDSEEMRETHVGEPLRLRLDNRSRRVWINKEEVLPPLSLSQYNLLELLYEAQGRVISRQELIEKVWGDEDAVGVSEQAFDALVRRLRDRLASIDHTHHYIITIRGHGLRLDNPPTNE